jgi:tetratricopeptide (TPR) repeat protein
LFADSDGSGTDVSSPSSDADGATEEVAPQTRKPLDEFITYKAVMECTDANIAKLMDDRCSEEVREQSARGACGLQAGDYRGALEASAAALEIDSQCVQSLLTLGDMGYFGGRYNEAVAFYAKAIEIDPEEPKAYEGIGKINYIFGRDDSAEKYLVAAANLSSKDDAGPTFLLGKFLITQGRSADATRVLLATYAIAPKSPQVHHALGQSLMLKQHWPRAEDAFRTAIGLDKTFAPAWVDLAAVLTEKRGGTGLEEAEQAVREGIRLDPGVARAHYILGIVLEEMGEQKDAVKAYLEALRLDKNHGGAIHKLSKWYVSQGDYDLALDLLEGALRLDPDDTFTKLRIAIVLVRGDMDTDRGLGILNELVKQAREGDIATLGAYAILQEINEAGLDKALKSPDFHEFLERVFDGKM